MRKGTPRAKNLIGRRFGRLVVTARSGTKGSFATWDCDCDCGGKKIGVRSTDLTGGMVKSCNCLRVEACGYRFRSHGKSKTRLYRCWQQMVYRCHRPGNAAYKDYGARGILVCEEWHDMESFFSWATSNGYADDLEIDRIDNDRGYSPDNCRWTTKIVNANNRRVSARRVFLGKEMTLKEASRHFGIPYTGLWARLDRGWDPDEAVTRPFRKTPARRSSPPSP